MLEDLLIHTAQVYRRDTNLDGSRVTDRFGQQKSVNPRQHQVDGEALVGSWPCRVARGRGGLTMTERSVDVFEATYMMYTETDVDINEDDGVRVLDENGSQVVPLCKVKIKTLASDAVGGHHYEFELWAQRGPL